MTTTNDRLAEIRARLTESGEIENERNNNLTFLLSLVEQLQGQLDAVRAIRLADGDWSGSYRMGYHAALRDVRGVLAEGVPGDR